MKKYKKEIKEELQREHLEMIRNLNRSNGESNGLFDDDGFGEDDLQEYYRYIKNDEKQAFHFIVSKQGHVWIDKVMVEKAAYKIKKIDDLSGIETERYCIDIPSFVYGFKANDKYDPTHKDESYMMGSGVRFPGLKEIEDDKYYILKDGFDEQVDRAESKGLSSVASIFAYNSRLGSVEHSMLIIRGNGRPMHGELNNLFVCMPVRAVWFENMDLSKITMMTETFVSCSMLMYIDMQECDLSNVRLFCGTFRGCRNLRSVEVGRKDKKLEKVVSVHNMFCGCEQLLSAELNHFESRNIKNIDSLFLDCKSLRHVDIKDWDLRSLRYAEGAFQNNFNLRIDELTGIFRNSKLVDASGMFLNTNLCDISFFRNMDVSELVDATAMFAVTNIKTVDLSNLEFPKLKKMETMFLECYYLKKVNLDNLKTPNVRIIHNIFNGDKEIKKLDLSSWELREDQEYDLDNFFSGCRKLRTVKLWKKINSECVKSYRWMFNGCQKLKKVDFTGWKFGSIIDIVGMFKDTNPEVQIIMDDRPGVTRDNYITFDPRKETSNEQDRMKSEVLRQFYYEMELEQERADREVKELLY